MSAYIVSNKTMQRAVEAVLIAEAPYSTKMASKAEVTKLGTELFAMNQAALAARYGDNDEPPTFIGAAFHMPARVGKASIQQYKALNSLIYQCGEGDVPDTDLFKRIDQASDKLAGKILSSLPEYDAAEWG